MLTITFALDQENDGIEVRHDGKQVFRDSAPDGWTSYFQRMPRGVPVLLEYDNGDPAAGPALRKICDACLSVLRQQLARLDGA